MNSFYKFLLGDEIAKRSPAPELKVLMHAKRAAWRKVALHMREGLSLKTSLDKVMSNSLFWTREVYEKVESGPKGKGKDKGKAEAAWLAKNGKQEWYPNYEAVKEDVKGKGKGKAKAEAAAWPAEWAEANAKGQQFCKNFHPRSCAIKCGRSHSCPVYKTDGAVCNDGKQLWYSSQEKKTPSLESAIHAVAPELSNSVVAIDICRGKGNDLLAGEPYSSLCTAGKEGKLNHCGGGPMCRTWTIRLWIPKENGGVPLRGRSESTLWGLPTLTDARHTKCDDDSMLMLRLLYLCSLARLGNPNCSSFLEHHADPAVHSKVPGAEFCSPCWITKAVMAWGKELCLKLLTFDQCRLGQIVPKTTGSLTDLCLDWDMSFCNHADKHIHSRVQSSEDLSRYPWGMMMDIANAIAAKQKYISLLDSIFNVPEDPSCASNTPKVASALFASSSSPHCATGPEMRKDEIIPCTSDRPIRDGGGKPSPGRRAPPKRSLTALATVGTAIMKACPSAASDIMASLARQDRDMPFDPDMLATIRQLMCTGSWKVAKCQPFYLDLMTRAARKAFDIDSEFPLELRHGVPLGVDEETLCSPGPLGAIEEADKLRTIFDGAAPGMNDHIRKNTKEKTTCPGLADALYGLRWLQTYGQVPWWVPAEHIPIAAGATGPETAWEEEEWVLLKADVTKAHPLVLRLLYCMFPGLDWAFVYVDDFAFLIRRRWANKLAWALLATMAALGCPLSWKKTIMGPVNTWLGFQIQTKLPAAAVGHLKHRVMVALLRDISDGKRFAYDEIAEGLGRLQWATNAFPLVKPFLQPFWAWKNAVVTASFPSRLLRMIAKVILLLINSVITSTSPFCLTSSTHGATDAGADDTTATIGGWFSDLQNPRQVDVSWFFLQLTKDNAPWAFD
ncbi:unnamed protein product [Polarella glacialis]|uniref:Uncharacterized protein n=1 Tax=Polarella glacialis TaxID=89957 RepID=A0A813IRW1_POLGL|nr:unnamed protein product [Polarella glacialis]